MNINFNEVFDAFKALDEKEKKQAIIDFLKNDIIALNKLNKDINNNLNTKDVDSIMNVSLGDQLDIIYELLHLLTEEIELFSEKISQDFFE